MEVSAFTVSKHLTDLVGRSVAAELASSVTFAPDARFACYAVLPNDGTAVVQIDFALLAWMAATMIGYSPAETEAQVRTGKLDENLQDAARELMNIMSSVVVAEGRAIFKGLYPRPADFSDRAAVLARGEHCPLRLKIKPMGGKPGSMMIASDR